MEEVDKIIVHILKNIGCDFEEDVTSIKQFSEELVVEATVRCVELIKPGTGLPLRLPPSMSARLRIATLISQAVKDLGYRGDMGYQTLLYFNELDIRRMFMFLIEMLPRDMDKSMQSKIKNQYELLESDITATIQKTLQTAWSSPFVQNEQKFSLQHPFQSIKLSLPFSILNVSYEKKEYYARYLAPVTEQCSSSKLIPSLILLNNETENSEEQLYDLLQTQISETYEPKSFIKDHESDSSLSNNHFMENEISALETTNENINSAMSHIEEVSKNIDLLKHEIKSLESDLKVLTAKESQLIEHTRIEEATIEKTVKEMRLKSKVHALLAEKNVNVSQLEEILEANTIRLMNVAKQWDQHRHSLIEKYRDVQENQGQQQLEVTAFEEKLTKEIQKYQEYSNEVKIKHSLCKQLQENCAKLSNTVNRSAYTRRIMEIIGNIWKQSAEIDKVLEDMKILQKEINISNGKLNRSFVLADEIIFRDAKQEETSRKAYKLLATLHSDCSELSQLAMQIGSVVRETRDLQEQLETEQNRNTVEQLNRITNDLNQIKQEIQAQKNIKLQKDIKLS